MADICFGLDISHHQDLALDLARCKREGISFVFLKATEGSGFVDSEFAANLAEARAAGLLVAAYHYVRSTATAATQVAHISRVVPKDVPVIPDVEANSGGIALTRDLVTRLQQAGYRVPLLYLPRWYWQQLGSPSLADLPPLWSSRYPDNVVGTIPDEWADVPARYWDGYGGLTVAVLQFTSSAAVAGHQPLDANAYRGTPRQLAALLGGAIEEDDMPTADEVAKAVLDTDIGGSWTLRKFLAGYALGEAGVRSNGAFVNEVAVATRTIVAGHTGQIAALTELVRQLANDEDLDLEAVKAAAKSGTAEALAEGTVNVDVDIAVGGNPINPTT